MSEMTPQMMGTVDPSALLGAAGYNAAVDRLAADLLRRLQPAGAPPAKVKLGVVAATSASAWTAEVRIGGSTVAIPSIPVLGSLPAINSTVVILSFGSSFVVLGQLVGSDGTGTFREAVAAAAMAAGDVRQVAQNALAQATSATNVTLPGLTFTVDSPGTTAAWTVSISADVDIRIASTNIIELLADGVAQAPQIITAGPAGTRGAGFKEWLVTGLAAGARAFTARTRNTAASTDARVNSGHTLMTIKRVL